MSYFNILIIITKNVMREFIVGPSIVLIDMPVSLIEISEIWGEGGSNKIFSLT